MVRTHLVAKPPKPANPAGDAEHAARSADAKHAEHIRWLNRWLSELDRQYETDLDDMARRADMMGYND